MGLGTLLGGVGEGRGTSHPLSELVTRTFNSLVGKAENQGFHLGHKTALPIYFPRVWIFARTCLMAVNKTN